MDDSHHLEKVAGSWKGNEKDKAFVERARQKKTPELEAANSERVEVELENEKNFVEEEKVERLSGLTLTEHDTEEAAEPCSPTSPESEDILTGEVEMHILEVFPNLPVSPIQKMEASTYHPAVSPVEFTPQSSSPPPLGVDVTEFQLSWKEVRKRRQMETVQKYKEKLQNEASFLFKSF